MPAKPGFHYDRILVAIDDARMALHDVLEDPDTTRRLPRQDWDLLRRIAEELRTLQGRLEDEAEDVTRDRRVDHLLAEMDDIAEETS
jgi:hypothetical protein